MRSFYCWAISTLALLLGGLAALADVKATVEHIPNDEATPQFKFKNIPGPLGANAATKAKITIVDGARDENGGDVSKINDGKLPNNEDEPEENFFFDAGTPGGRLQMDLGKVIDIGQINTYSWHPNTRGPQVYKLYASDGSAKDFNAEPKNGTDPAKVGWTLVATVDTRPKSGPGGGQHGVSIADSNGAAIGKYRYLLFDVSRTEADDEFGNTFWSEITVVEKK
jgi:hypothetical protein